MKKHRIKLPLRDDHTVVLILADHEHDEQLAKTLGEDEEWMANKDAFALDNQSGTFYVVLYVPTSYNLVHELGHVCFYVADKFNVRDQEFFCMMLEYLFTKLVKYLPDKV